jgi:hypothetical protein
MLLREMRDEQAVLARQLAQRVQRVALLRLVLLEDLRLVGDDVGVHEGADTNAECRELGR